MKNLTKQTGTEIKRFVVIHQVSASKFECSVIEAASPKEVRPFGVTRNFAPYSIENYETLLKLTMEYNKDGMKAADRFDNMRSVASAKIEYLRKCEAKKNDLRIFLFQVDFKQFYNNKPSEINSANIQARNFTEAETICKSIYMNIKVIGSYMLKELN